MTDSGLKNPARLYKAPVLAIQPIFSILAIQLVPGLEVPVALFSILAIQLVPIAFFPILVSQLGLQPRFLVFNSLSL